MALQHSSSASNNDVGIDLTNCYTIIKSAGIEKMARYRAPIEEGGDPILITKFTLKFSTETYVSAEACANNKNTIAQHNYEEDYLLDYAQENTIAYCYEWLKTNVSLYSEATSV